MKDLLEEIREIPDRAEECFKKNKKISLPEKVPYFGMGSSYYAPLTLFYCGADINPQIASEYYLYLSEAKSPLGVFISQSGESSEMLWCLERCQEAVAVVNNTESSLAKAMNVKKVVDLYAGKEKMSSTKTYVNTLISLYLGLKINPQKAIQKLRKNFFPLQAEVQEKAQKITRYLKSGKVKGFYVIGSGPNLGTAYEAALTLSETTKLPWNGMSVAQYDHGPKETADNTVVLILNAHGKDERRILLVKDVLRQRSNALVVELNENNLLELVSPLTLIVQANFLMNFLADELQVGNTFKLGGKITRVSL